MRHLTDEQLWDLTDGLATAPEKALCEAHLAACAGCHARHQTLLAVNARLAQMPMQTPSPAFTDLVVARWEAERQPALAAMQNRRVRTAPLVFGAWLAVLAIAVLVSVLAYPVALPVPAVVSGAVRTGGQVLASKSFLNGLLLANALLLLWLLDRRVLAPFFKNRLVAKPGSPHSFTV